MQGAVFAGIEQLIDQFSIDCCELNRYDMNNSENSGSLWSVAIMEALAMRVIRHSSIAMGCCNAQPMAIQTSFGKKVTGPQNGDHGFLALFGNHGELQSAFLDGENGSPDVALRENNLILSIIVNGSPANLPSRETLWDRTEAFLCVPLQALLIVRDTPHARRSYEASREGNARHTMVPASPLSRATWPPSCRAKVSTQPAAEPWNPSVDD